MEYSDISKNLTKQISNSEKKQHGIYFTPPSIIYKHKNILDTYTHDVKDVLEPSCGSGEYIQAFQNKNYNITGIELNKTIFDTLTEGDYVNTKFIHADFLSWKPSKQFDLIIGNPPYFVMKKTEIDPCYSVYYTGRPNIFVAFIVKSLSILKINGILGFVLPKSFLNCMYYDKLRKYISETCQIIDITLCSDDKYIETKQETILFTVQKTDKYNNDKFIYSYNTNIIFNTPGKIETIRKLYERTTTLEKMGMTVNVGNIVWNQKKHILTDDETSTRLIYSSDIKDNSLSIVKYKNTDKKNYINEKGETGPLLVINRGYGTGKYSFNYCLIDMEREYLIENHLMCIRPNVSMERDELLDTYYKIIRSFDHVNTSIFIEIYFGNSAINTYELRFALPIY
jgi:type I restriction-modification system DNA methylase subunit